MTPLRLNVLFAGGVGADHDSAAVPSPAVAVKEPGAALART
mgnify:CR=1 FL=1